MRDAVAQSLGFVVPVMGVAYLTPLVAIGAGAATPLAMLLGGIGVLCIGLVIAQFARQYPHAGSMYEYVSRTAGPFPGFIVGWIYFVGAFFLTVGILPGVGAFIQGTLASHNWTVPWLPFAIGLLILSSIVQYIDVRVATRVVLWIVFISAGVILIFAIYVIIRGGAEGNSLKFFMPSSATGGLSGVWFGLIFAFLMYSGFEASAVLSEETKDARRVIAVTVLAAVGIIIGYFVIVVYAEAISYGLKDANEVWPTDPTPLFTMGAKYDVANAGSATILTQRYQGDWNPSPKMSMFAVYSRTDGFLSGRTFATQNAGVSGRWSLGRSFDLSLGYQFSKGITGDNQHTVSGTLAFRL